MSTRTTTAVLMASGLFIVSSGTARADYMSEVLADGPAAYFRMNEYYGTEAINSAVPSFPSGTYVNSPLLGQPSDPRAIPGALGTSVEFGTGSFPATNQAISVPQMITSYQGVTWEFWMNADSFDTWTAIFNHDEWNYGSVHCQFTGNRPQVGINGASPGYNFTFSTRFDTQRWYYVVLALSAVDASIDLYVDGEWEETVSKNSIPSPINIASGEIANWNDKRNLDGRYDEMAVYTYKLSDDRVRAHWEAATIPEPSTLVLLIAGALGLVGFARRRRKGR